jgi:ribosomal protein L21
MSTASCYSKSHGSAISEWFGPLFVQLVAYSGYGDSWLAAVHIVHAVVPDDKIFLHRLNGVDINDVVAFKRVLLCGTPSDTLIGRPFLPGVTVTAAVEEHIRDSTVYIYKRKRARGYRRFRGFRAVCHHLLQDCTW